MTAVDADSSREHWDAQAATYDKDKARNATYYRALKSLIEQAIPTSHRGRVLDVGCGTGQVLAALSPRQGMGIDSSEQMIQRARARHADRPELEFVVADALSAPGPFDAVICADVLEHVADWVAVIDALAEACDGILAVTTPNPLWALPLWVLEKLGLKMPEGPHRYVTARDITARLRNRGLTIDRNETHLLVPARLGGFGPRFSRACATLPILGRLGVIQLVVARRPGPRESES